MQMASAPHNLHFLLLPYPSPGHLIPMADIARLLSQQQGVSVTIVTTPLNAARIRPMIHHSGSPASSIRLVEFEVPLLEAGLPEGCESMELIPSRNLFRNFIEAFSKLQKPLEQLIRGSKPAPACLLADKHLHWPEAVCRKFQIPRLLFDGTSCFYNLCLHNLLNYSKAYETLPQSQPFVVPGDLPHRIEFTRAQLPLDLNPENQDLSDIHQKIRAHEEGAYGMVVNSFEDLESDYVKQYQKVKGAKLWCIGPVSLSYRAEDVAQRGNKAIVDENFCMKWLDSKPPRSVVYVCLGTINRLSLVQFKELALALEASNRPFICVIREDDSEEEKKWLTEDGFEERTKGRGLIICGWAPQVLMLSHPAMGVFLTHCGWNSTLEAICAGVPMVTWPLFGDQFFNHKLIVQILGVGEALNEVFVPIGKQDKFGVVIKREKILEAIDKVMGEGAEQEEKRERARKLAELAKKSVEAGGSSYLNIKMLVDDIGKLAFGNPTQ